MVFCLFCVLARTDAVSSLVIYINNDCRIHLNCVCMGKAKIERMKKNYVLCFFRFACNQPMKIYIEQMFYGQWLHRHFNGNRYNMKDDQNQ